MNRKKAKKLFKKILDKSFKECPQWIEELGKL